MLDNDRNDRRHELLVCVANARHEQNAGRGEGLDELLGRIAKLPPELVREFVIPHYGFLPEKPPELAFDFAELNLDTQRKS